MIQVSLIVPVLNEECSIDLLISSIQSQTRMPDEVVFVDGGSTDRTVELIEGYASKNNPFRVIKAGKATPGRGRNIGVENALYDWIAFTDAGIKLDPNWLELLVSSAENDGSVDVVYGNCDVLVENFFVQCALFAYVTPKQFKDGELISSKFIASSLMRRLVWEKVGGFPDLRAAEDLIFMEAVEKADFKISHTPHAKVFWQLRPDLVSTFQKFVLYSKHNVWVKREWDWHYGILKQYLLVIPFILLSLIHSWWWLLGVVIWAVARTVKRITAHHLQFGIAQIFNPLVFLQVTIIIFTVDIATFIGWGKAHLEKRPELSLSNG